MRRGQHWLLLVWWRQRILRRRKGKEVGRDPIEVTHIHPFEFLVSAHGVSKRLAEEGREDTYSSRPNSRRFTIPFSLAFHTPYTTSCTFSTKSACEYPASRNGMSGGSHWASGDSARCGGQLWTRTCTNNNQSRCQMKQTRHKTHHIARQQTAGISPRTAIRPAPKHNHTALVLRVAENVMQRHSKTVQVANVQRTEIMVERVIQQGVVDSEVHRLQARRVDDGTLTPLVRGPGDVRWDMLRRGLVWIGDRSWWEGRVGCGWGGVGRKIKAVWRGLAMESRTVERRTHLRCTQ